VRALPAILALVLGAGVAHATQPINLEPPRPLTLADSSNEKIARQAAWWASAVTIGGTVGGICLGMGGRASGADGIGAVGVGIVVASVLVGPSVGWTQAGYPGRAALGAVGRIAMIAGGAAIAGGGDSDPIAAILGGLLGMGFATLEAGAECGMIGSYVRSHGAGSRARRAGASLVPAVAPSGAPAVAMTFRW